MHGGLIVFMLRHCLILFGLIAAVASLPAKPPVPLRLIGFDPIVRKVGKVDAQEAKLQLVEGRRAGKVYTVYLMPSHQTAALVGRQLYLRLPIEWLGQKDHAYYAGELLDFEPSWVPPDFLTTVPFKEGKAEAYVATRVALDGINEVNGTFLPPGDPARWIKAADAIAAAEKVYPDGVQGTFVFQIKGGADLGRETWLNSETDYKDPHSLNVGLPLSIVKDFELRHGAEIVPFLKGKTIAVTGVAQRVKIETAKPGEFYYQTQVQLWSAHQIRIVE